MNQILLSKETNKQNKKNSSSLAKKNFNFFKFQFIFCSIFALLITGYYFYTQYTKKQQESLSSEIIDRFSITNLYDNTNSNYSALRSNAESTYQTNSLGFSVIGLIEIKSIGVYYPIINEFSYELLKIAPCKFSGPSANQVRQSLYCWSQL